MSSGPGVIGARLQLPLQQQLSADVAWIAAVAGGGGASCGIQLERGRVERCPWERGAPLAVAHAVCVLATSLAMAVCGSHCCVGGRWRHVRHLSRQAAGPGWSVGPALGDELRRLRRQRLADLR